MLRTRASALLLLGLTLMTGACQPKAPTTFADADGTALRAADAAAVEAIRSKNWVGWAATFTEDGTVLPPNGAAVQGRAAIQAWAEAFPPMSDFQATIVAVDGRGDLAYIRGTYSMNLNIPGAPAPIADRGKYISIWQKQADGSWLAVHDIFNSDLPMAPAPAAAQ